MNQICNFVVQAACHQLHLYKLAISSICTSLRSAPFEIYFKFFQKNVFNIDLIQGTKNT